MISEIFPLQVRSQALSIAVVTNFTANLIVSATYLSLQNLLGLSGSYGTYWAVSILSIVFVLFLVPETKNRSLEQIEEMLEGPLVLNPVREMPPSIRRYCV
jgi:MFS transporter, SP family, galactose:H+ symporter